MRLIAGSLAVRALSPSSFPADPWWPLDTADNLRQWLVAEAQKWSEVDPCFAANRAIATTELAAGPEYEKILSTHAAAATAYHYAPGRRTILETENAMAGGEKAIAGLRAFANGGSADDSEELRMKRQRAAEKLSAYVGSDADRQDAVQRAQAACSEWQSLQAAADALEAERTRLGLPELESSAKALSRQKGAAANRGGHAFEREAGEPLFNSVTDALISANQTVADLVVLNSVTLGMARAEIDLLVCAPRQASGEGDVVPASLAAANGFGSSSSNSNRVLLDAIALCEVKRDSSDIGTAVVKSHEVVEPLLLYADST